MQLLLYEYACAQAADRGLPRSVCIEGRAMCNALREDFERTPGVEVVTLPPGAPQAEPAAFRTLLSRVDAALAVAPEFDGLLLERSRWIEESGVLLLGSTSRGVLNAGDKWKTHQVLLEAGVPVPRTWLDHRAASAADGFGKLLRKPRHGAGSIGIRWAGEAAGSDAGDASILWQEYVPGMPASASFLVAGTRVFPLRAGVQRLGEDFAYLGGELPLDHPREQRAMQLAERAVRAVPGLRGFVGVDLVLGMAANGSDDVVIEVNPRVTTSYVGLRRLCEGNLAGVWLDLLRGRDTAPLSWRPGRLRFTAEGNVFLLPED